MMATINRGWFKQGVSGNPQGRPRDAFSHASAKRLVETTIAKALAGDTSATATLADNGIQGDKAMRAFFRDQRNRPRQRTCDQTELHVIHPDEPGVSPEMLYAIVQRIDRIEQVLIALAQRDDEENGNGNNVEDAERETDPYGHELYELNETERQHQRDRRTIDRAFQDEYTARTKRMQADLRKINQSNRQAAGKAK